MKYLFLHERKSWYICFSSVLIQIKVIGQILEIDRDFWEANLFKKHSKKRGQCSKCETLSSAKINNSLLKFE